LAINDTIATDIDSPDITNIHYHTSTDNNLIDLCWPSNYQLLHPFLSHHSNPILSSGHLHLHLLSYNDPNIYHYQYRYCVFESPVSTIFV